MSQNPPRHHLDYDGGTCSARWMPSVEAQREAEQVLDRFRAERAQRELLLEYLPAGARVGHVVHPVDGAERDLVESMFGDFDSTFPEHTCPEAGA